MPQEKNVSQGDEDDLFDESVLERVDGVTDENAAVVERDDLDALWESGLNVGIFCLTAVITSSALVP